MLQLNSEKHFDAENVGREWKGGFHHEAIWTQVLNVTTIMNWRKQFFHIETYL